MAVKIGDKVRYLNAIGGGTVTKFQSKDIVLVEEDGFESPVLIRDIVVVQATNEYNFPVEELQSKKNNTPTSTNSTEIIDEPELEIPYSWSERDETPEGEKMSVYLAFVPKEIKKLQTTDMELYIINDSNYFMQFSICNGKDDMKLIAQNLIEPQTKLYIEDINKLALNEYEFLRFQGLAYKRTSFRAKPAIDFSIRINPIKFYKLHTFKENDFFNEDAMLIPIIENDIMNFETLISAADLQKAIQEKDSPKIVKQNNNKRPEIIEVDLHINELLDNSNGLSNFEMLTVQMNKFHEVMKANLKFKGQKIVFIHGKGEGVLRAEIEKQIKQKYKHCRYHDASFQQYGFGATQIIIK